MGCDYNTGTERIQKEGGLAGIYLDQYPVDDPKP